MSTHALIVCDERHMESMMDARLKTIIAITVFALVITGSVITYNMLSKQVMPENNIKLAEGQGNITDSKNQKQKAPDFTMVDSEGNNIKLSEMIGKPIVLNFWASWCPPCKSEMPEFDKVYKELGSDIRFMMVDLTDGKRETVENGAKYIKEQGFSFPVYYDTKQEGANAYSIMSIPTTLFIDKDGYIVTGAQGAINESTLRKGIKLIQ